MDQDLHGVTCFTGQNGLSTAMIEFGFGYVTSAPTPCHIATHEPTTYTSRKLDTQLHKIRMSKITTYLLADTIIVRREMPRIGPATASSGESTVCGAVQEISYLIYCALYIN